MENTQATQSDLNETFDAAAQEALALLTDIEAPEKKIKGIGGQQDRVWALAYQIGLRHGEDICRPNELD